MPRLVTVLSLCQALLRLGVKVKEAAALMRLHKLPQIYMNINSLTIGPLAHSCGALASSQSASTMARIVIEDSILSALPEFVQQK